MILKTIAPILYVLLGVAFGLISQYEFDLLQLKNFVKSFKEKRGAK